MSHAAATGGQPAGRHRADVCQPPSAPVATRVDATPAAFRVPARAPTEADRDHAAYVTPRQLGLGAWAKGRWGPGGRRSAATVRRTLRHRTRQIYQRTGVWCPPAVYSSLLQSARITWPTRSVRGRRPSDTAEASRGAGHVSHRDCTTGSGCAQSVSGCAHPSSRSWSRRGASGSGSVEIAPPWAGRVTAPDLIRARAGTRGAGSTVRTGRPGVPQTALTRSGV